MTLQVKYMSKFIFLMSAEGLVLNGTVEGKVIRTTLVKFFNTTDNQVMTASGTVYELSEPNLDVSHRHIYQQYPQEYEKIRPFIELKEKTITEKPVVAVIDEPDVIKFKKMLADHDYYYAFTDDINVWRNGESERNAIEAMVRANLACAKLWDDYKKENTDKTW